MYFIFILLMFLTPGSPAGLNSDVLKNQLHFEYGVNFKFNGQLYHNLERVWVVHSVLTKGRCFGSLAQFPKKFGLLLVLREYAIPGTQSNLARKPFLKQLCEITIPNFQLLKK